MGTWIEGKPWDTINGQFDFKVATKSFKLGKLLNGCRKTPAPGQKNRMNLFFKPWKIYRTAVHIVAPSQAAAKVHAWLTTYFIVKEFPLVAGKQSCPGPKTSSGRVFPHVLWGEDGQPHGQRANATLILWLPFSQLASSQSHHHHTTTKNQSNRYSTFNYTSLKPASAIHWHSVDLPSRMVVTLAMRLSFTCCT